MTDFTAVIDHYMEMWNEPDPERRRDLIAQTFTEDASYLGPLLSGEGHDGIEELASNIRGHLPGHQFRRTGAIDAHNDRIRITWEIVPWDGEPRFAAGTDFGVVAEDGRLSAWTVFLDQAPDFPGEH